MIGAEEPEDLAKLIGRSVYDFAPAASHELARERRREVLESGIVAPPIEIPLLRPDGSSITAESLAVPFVYAGRPAILNLIRDISGRKRAENERNKAVAREQKAREEFTRQLIASQEAERSRIAGELHDSLGQNLLLIKNRAQLALTSDGGIPAALREQLEAVNQVASQAISEVRQIAHDLHPYQLDHLGLTGALDAMLTAAAESTGIVIERKLDPVDDVFGRESATHVYRLVQESLNNVLKHSRAIRARVTLERDVREVRLWIEDDGCGFQSDEATRGLGLKNMAERVRILGGRFKVDSRPGQGTRAEATVPIADGA